MRGGIHRIKGVFLLAAAAAVLFSSPRYGYSQSLVELTRERQEAVQKKGALEAQIARTEAFIRTLRLPQDEAACNTAQKALSVSRKGLESVKAVISRLEKMTAPPVDASTVDLRHLDPNKPIIVDPNVVAGRLRAFCPQVGACYPAGADYDLAFQEIGKGDPAKALAYLKKAAAENPGNPLVTAATGFAEDLLKVRRAEEIKKKQDLAFAKSAEGVVALRLGNVEKAAEYFNEAERLDPQDKGIRNAAGYARTLARQKWSDDAYRMADKSLVPIMRKDYTSARQILEQANLIFPENQNLRELLSEVIKWEKEAKGGAN